MPFNGIFRRKSHKIDSGSIRSTAPTSSLSGGYMSGDTVKMQSTPTRRPANLPSITNPFTHSNTPNTSAANNAASSEAPPPYSGPVHTVAPSTDNPYAFLSTFDTIFLIDDSGSMSGSKWRETSAALSAITPICTSHDVDGIDIHFLNTPDSPTYLNITSAERVTAIFERVKPGGGTPTGQRLNAILKPYLARLEQKGRGKADEVKPLNIIVLTDGEAHDDPESVILSAARKLDRLDAPSWQIGIQFFQVGNDPEATRALRDLDDGLIEMGCERDIVDTVPWRGESGRVGLDADGILKCVLGSVLRKLDRKRVSLDQISR
ncbi:MAG: hypothetical protein Q9163_000189 [Psora crenata]